jgi:hypothetical protein
VKVALLVGVFCLAVLSAALLALLGERKSRRAVREPTVWIPLLLLLCVTVSGVGWESCMLTYFARQSGSDIRGVVARPVPFTALYSLWRFAQTVDLFI